LKTKHKRLIIGLASIAALDFAAILTMFADPDLTERVIPALGAIQIFGFVAIAVIVSTSRQEDTLVADADREPERAGRQWLPWLFGSIALLSFMRVGMALLFIAGNEGHRHSWFSPIAGAAMGCFFLWMAVKSRPNQAIPNMNAIQQEVSAGSFTVDRAYYLSRENSWSEFKPLAYDDVGRLVVSDAKIVFQSASRSIVIDQIRQVSYGKQGRDFMNNWVKVEYLDGNTPSIAFFTDGGSLGWSGFLGGTARIFKAMKQLPTIA
jgi:hypothetical protein